MPKAKTSGRTRSAKPRAAVPAPRRTPVDYWDQISDKEVNAGYARAVEYADRYPGEDWMEVAYFGAAAAYGCTCPPEAADSCACVIRPDADLHGLAQHLEGMLVDDCMAGLL